MKSPKASLIIAVYKDLRALELILEALRGQSLRDFEIIVAEDNDDPATKALLARYHDLTILHSAHPDTGRTKAAAQNKAVCLARGQRLIFIDGDCIPYRRFVEGHLALGGTRRVVSGRRVNLPSDLSTALREGRLTSRELESKYWRYALTRLAWNREAHAEQGIQLSPGGRLHRWLDKRERNASILGCNFSCETADFTAINGFDEAYGLSILGDDTDLNWRFPAYGSKLVSGKNIANVFHLHHDRPSYDYDATQDLARFHSDRAEAQFYCRLGLDQYRPVPTDTPATAQVSRANLDNSLQ
jgi:glycosyltransferase involved in cell wall biosynthesis